MYLQNHVMRASCALALLFPLAVLAARDGSPTAGTVDAFANAARPVSGKIYVLDVVVSEKGILLDFADSAEVFREIADVPFAIHYIAATMDPVTLKGGLKI